MCQCICFIHVNLISFVILKCLPSAYFAGDQGKSVFISTVFLQSASSNLNVHWSLDTN